MNKEIKSDLRGLTRAYLAIPAFWSFTFDYRIPFYISKFLERSATWIVG